MQQTEFEVFPGPILFSTNCIMKPKASYIDRCYATGCVGYEGVKYIVNDNWDDVIQTAKKMSGFKDDTHCEEIQKKI